MNGLLTVKQVAQKLDRCERTIRNWINRGWLPAIRPTGYNYWIKEADLHRLFGGVNNDADTGHVHAEAENKKCGQGQ